MIEPGSIHVGDVTICPIEQKNPYRSDLNPYLMGEPRKRALAQFKHGKLPVTLVAWFAPSSGGARILNDPALVDWETSGIE